MSSFFVALALGLNVPRRTEHLQLIGSQRGQKLGAYSGVISVLFSLGVTRLRSWHI